jgi:hemolysin activation/secretion protein
LNNAASNFSQFNSDLSFFTSFQWPARFIIATRVGGGINFGHYEFYQSQYLSGTENLRGYRKFRFAGDKIFYSNTEVRMKVADINTYLFPGALGILGFYDVGRVWMKGETSKSWHKGYGGGLWLIPLNRFVITACYTTSKEGALPLISFGFQF